MKKVLSIFGTRPEAIKMAPVVKAIEKSENLEGVVCVTAQHREMLDQVLRLFEIAPEYDLDLMGKGQDLTDITSRILVSLREVFAEEHPDVVLVHGDTTTSFAATLASFYAGIPVGHIEAGLRTNNLASPFPEEGNRKLTGTLASYHFAPTEKARENLLHENVNAQDIVVTGNAVIDALLMAKERVPDEESQTRRLLGQELFDLIENSAEILLVTGHRRENFGEGILNICEALKEIAGYRPNLEIIYPVHLNPNVREPVYSLLSSIKNIHLIEPLDYLPFVALLQECTLVLTDSGGIQEEASVFGKPVLVMRNATERPEAVEAGTVKLVGTDKKKIVSQVLRLLEDKEYYRAMAKKCESYGDGKAASKIVRWLSTH